MRLTLRSALPHLRLGAGVFVTGGLLALAGAALGSPLLIAPFLATAALKHAAPHDPALSARHVIGGHLIGATVGVTFGALLGLGPLGVATAAATAAVIMLSLDAMHAPGVATAVVAVHEHADHWFPVHIALVGALVLVGATVLLSPVLHGRRATS